MKKILLLNFLLLSFVGFAQDCSSLRKPNETYGAGEGKAVSWCNMQNPTAYTDCMCKQEKANKVSAEQQQQLQNQALQKSTEASSLYQQAHNLATQADIDKDPSKLDKAKKLYQQAIALSNEAKGYIEQAYAGADASYTNLKNLYLEQYDKQIAWATTGIDNIASQKEHIKKSSNPEKITKHSKSPGNNWTMNKTSTSDNSWQLTASNSKQNESWGSQTEEGMEKVTKVVNREVLKNGDCDNSISLTYSEEGYVDASGKWVVDPIKSVSVGEIKAPPRLLLTRSDCDYDCKKRMEKQRNERYRKCNQLLKDKIASIQNDLKSQGYIVK